jgi:spore germination cell wall hydrolase CwlJ-like protein
LIRSLERWFRPAWARTAGVAALAAIAAGPACAPSGDGLAGRTARLAVRDLTDASLQRLAARMDPAMRALALRHDPGLRRTDFWSRPTGWGRLDIDDTPNLGIPATDAAAAEALNALRPVSDLPIRPMRPFVLRASGEDRARAVECLTQAVYYEAAREPEVGQEAVAQVVLNRVRHPAYPKSICGVVYQGAARATGCQFTFTCDGSLQYAPQPALWRRARQVAERALDGFVDKQVGSATHYHADYVAPYWAPTLVKMAQVGQHIFYRWTGPWGEPAAFTGRYAGREAYLTPAILGGTDARTQGLLAPEDQLVPARRTITLAVAGEVRTYDVVDPEAADGVRTRVAGALTPSRRKPTPDEIKRINASLAEVERSLDAQDRAPQAAAAASQAAPAVQAAPGG